MTRRQKVYYVLATLVLLAFAPARLSADDPYEQIKPKYSLGSIYLTYIPLNDITILLNDPVKFEQLCQRPPGRDVLQTFRTFLNQQRERNINEAVAFLQLELSSTKAGFKKLSDNDGVIRVINWSDEQVKGIAIFCDAFLNGLTRVNELMVMLGKNDTTIKAAWQAVDALLKDPYVPGTRAAPTLQKLRELMNGRADEMQQLLRQDPNFHESLQDFMSKFDASMLQGAALNGSDERVERLWRELHQQEIMENRLHDSIMSSFPGMKQGNIGLRQFEPTPFRQLLERPRE